MSVQAFVKFCLIVIGLAGASLAQASYDRSCEELLARSPYLTSEFDATNEQGQFARMVGLDHEMSALEYMALKDFLAGLSLKLIFRGAKPLFVSEATPAELKVVGNAMNRAELIEVAYRPSALKKVGEVLWRVCLVMGLNGCEVYNRFKGFLDPTYRPLSPIEEQGVAWVTFSNLAPATFESIYIEAVSQIGRSHAYSVATDMARKAEFNTLVLRDFIRQDRFIMVQAVVVPMISESWQKALSQVRGKLN